MFKAQKPRAETKGAEEVKDTNETVHDIPVDLQDAVTVEVKCLYYLDIDVQHHIYIDYSDFTVICWKQT